MGVDLNWADNQYLSTLLGLVGEFTKLSTPPKKEKVSASEIGKFIDKEV